MMMIFKTYFLERSYIVIDRVPETVVLGVESAMEKQLACAAATNSSGLVFDSAPSVRVFQDTGKSLKVCDEPEETTPDPESRSPVQIALAVLDVAILFTPHKFTKFVLKFFQYVHLL